MKVSVDKDSYRLLGAIGALTLVFLGSSIYANWRTLAIDSVAEELENDALPDIEHASAAADALNKIEAAADDYPEATDSQRDAARESILRALRTADLETNAYLALPSVEGERAQLGDLRGSLAQVHEAVQGVFDEVDLNAGPVRTEAAVRRARVAVEKVIESLRQVMRFSTAEARTRIAHISQIRRSASHAALWMGGFSLCLGALAAFWVTLVFRRHASLARAHSVLIERRADELERFAERVAHDLLSPLSALVFCLSAFQRPAESDPRLQNALAQARSCVARARAMVSGIFEFARAGARPEPGASADVEEVVRQVAEEAAAADVKGRPDVEVKVAGHPMAACSQGVLTSVLTNLVQNAVKYTSDAPMRRIRVRATEEGGSVRIEVEDSGPGIPAELRGVIFEPYVRGQGATQAGLGLGLATVKRLCEAHGGSVGVRSAVGEGSMFWALLPRVRATAPPESRKPAGRHVLQAG
jgi:signal transduction histidine kinase